MYDIVIVGAGPAGLAAAIAAQNRGRQCLLLSNPVPQNPLYKTPSIPNYPGMPGVNGQTLLDGFLKQALDLGAELKVGRVLSAMEMEGEYYLTVGSEVYQGKRLILATGVQLGQKYPGEERLLGRGVSYCATCDGMLYRKRPVVVIGRAKDAPMEANYLHQIGCQVTYLSPAPGVGLREGIPHVRANRMEILGKGQVTGVRAGEMVYPCEGVFVLRESVAPGDLLPGLATEEGYLQVNRRMETNLPGVYAAGDCTGKPLQIAKAVGEGFIAGQMAAESLETH